MRVYKEKAAVKTAAFFCEFESLCKLRDRHSRLPVRVRCQRDRTARFVDKVDGRHGGSDLQQRAAAYLTGTTARICARHPRAVLHDGERHAVSAGRLPALAADFNASVTDRDPPVQKIGARAVNRHVPASDRRGDPARIVRDCHVERDCAQVGQHRTRASAESEFRAAQLRLRSRRIHRREDRHRCDGRIAGAPAAGAPAATAEPVPYSIATSKHDFPPITRDVLPCDIREIRMYAAHSQYIAGRITL